MSGGCELFWVMINTGSSADVDFYDAYKRMGFTKTLLKQEQTSLIGFVVETTYSHRSIELALTAEDVRKIVKLIMIDRPAPFNTILERSWLYNMKEVSSDLPPMPKISNPRGIETIRGSQKSSRTCYLASFKDIKSPSK